MVPMELKRLCTYQSQHLNVTKRSCASSELENQSAEAEVRSTRQRKFIGTSNNLQECQADIWKLLLCNCVSDQSVHF